MKTSIHCSFLDIDGKCSKVNYTLCWLYIIQLYIMQLQNYTFYDQNYTLYNYTVNNQNYTLYNLQLELHILLVTPTKSNLRINTIITIIVFHYYHYGIGSSHRWSHIQEDIQRHNLSNMPTKFSASTPAGAKGTGSANPRAIAKPLSTSLIICMC